MKRPCSEPQCPDYARLGSARCDEHTRERERERSGERRAHPERGKRVALYHRKRWLVTRRAILTRDPVCKTCGKRLSTECDHIVPLSQGGAPWDPKNLQGLCASCHAAKSGAESLPPAA